MDSRSLRLTTRPLPPEPLPRAEHGIPAPPSSALRRPTVEKALDHALRASSAGLVLLRGPGGTGRRTAVALWSRRLVDDGTVVVWVDVAVADALDGDTLGPAIRARLAQATGEGSPAPTTRSTAAESTATETAAAGSTIAESLTAESVAAALDAHEVVLVVDRLGPTSGAALSWLDRVARLLGRSRIVALTAMPLPGPTPTSDAWAHAADAAPDLDPVTHGPAHHIELTMRDLAVRAGEAHAAAAALGAPFSRSQARLLVTATAGWPAVLYPALEEIRRVSAAGDPVTDDLVSTAAAAHRAAFLRGALPEAAISVVVEASLAPRFSRAELAATGLLSAVPGAHTFVDRLVETGLLLDDPASPDDVLAVEPSARRAILDYARGRDRDELHLRAAKAVRRREQAHDTRGALLVALESGDAGLVRDLLQGMWTGILDGHDPTLHEALWGAASSTPVEHVPAELRALLSVTRRSPGRPGTHEPPPAAPGRPESSITTFARIARLRRAGRVDDALRLARGWLGALGGAPVVARVLVGLQASIAAAEAGLLHEALRHAETAHHGALGSGTLPLAAAAAELTAVVHALDSNVHAAGDWSAEAEALPEPPGWWRHAVGDPPALVAALAHLDRFDDDLPGHLLSAAHDAARSDLWFAGLHVEAVLGTLRRQEELTIDHLRESLAQRGLAPSETGGHTSRLRIPPLLSLDLGRLYLTLGRGTSAAVIADAQTAQSPARALLDARLRLAQGQPREALQALTGVRSAHEGSTAGARLEAHLMAAEAHAALDHGNHDGADVRRQLAHATALSRRVGGALPYWWAAPGVLRSLAREAPEQVRQIAQVLRRRSGPAPAEFVVVPDRQLFVLHGLADGLTSTQVAKSSFVSHNTVKTQIREIYRRLGVHDRASALQRARELGLLDPIVRARLRGNPSRP